MRSDYDASVNLTPEDTERKAKEANCTIEWADDTTLQVDFDNPHKLYDFWQRLDTMANLKLVDADFKETTLRRSRHGHYHITVPLRKPTSTRDRILLQSLLGSDPKREMLSLCRWYKGEVNPVCFFRPNAVKVQAISVDDEF